MRGFTLIEVAVVLFITMLLLGGLMVPFVTSMRQSQYKETEDRLEHAKEAILGFAAANGRLPRPAQSSTNGTEMGSCASEAACTGFLPWSTLGMNKLDPYGKLWKYSVTPAYATASGFSLTTTATKVLMSRQSFSPFSAYIVASAVPAIICSHGAINWGTGDSANAMVDQSLTNTDEDMNQTATVAFMSRTYTDNPQATGGEFDDVCVIVPRYTLFNRMIAAGKLP